MAERLVALVAMAVLLVFGVLEGEHNYFDGVAPSAFFGLAIATLIFGIWWGGDE